MKYVIPFIAVTGLAALFQINTVQATPLYYLFEGRVATYPISDEAGFQNNIDLNAGDAVSYAFMVDKDLQGTRRNELGELVLDEDEVSFGNQANNYFMHDSFYVELVESSLFDLVQNLYPDRGHDEPWVGSGYENSGYHNGVLEAYNSEVYLGANSASMGSSHMYIYSDMSIWEIGSTISLDNSTLLYGDQTGESFSFHSELTLTTISATNPADLDISLISNYSGGSEYEIEGKASNHKVPEPSTFLLMGLGLLGIGAGRFRKFIRF
jgi:hypothetical protein